MPPGVSPGSDGLGDQLRPNSTDLWDPERHGGIDHDRSSATERMEPRYDPALFLVRREGDQMIWAGPVREFLDRVDFDSDSGAVTQHLQSDRSSQPTPVRRTVNRRVTGSSPVRGVAKALHLRGFRRCVRVRTRNCVQRLRFEIGDGWTLHATGLVQKREEADVTGQTAIDGLSP
jgi:hypothetical protein